MASPAGLSTMSPELQAVCEDGGSPPDSFPTACSVTDAILRRSDQSPTRTPSCPVAFLICACTIQSDMRYNRLKAQFGPARSGSPPRLPKVDCRFTYSSEMPKTSWESLSHYGSALVAIALATMIRLALDPLLGDRFPFFVFFLAIVFTA
jgi:hypothetical protein